MVRRRSGFGLVEILVSLGILVAGALGAASAVSWAAHRLRSADEDEAILTLAETLLDSLLEQTHVAPGMRVTGRGRIAWDGDASAAGTDVRIIVLFDRASARGFETHATRVRPPPLMDPQ